MPVSSKEFLHIQATIECRFTLKRICDMIRTCSLMHQTVHISNHNTAQSFGQSAKWLSVPLQTMWLWVRVQLQSVKLQILRLFRAKSSLKFRQLQSANSHSLCVHDMIRTYSLIITSNVGTKRVISFICFVSANRTFYLYRRRHQIINNTINMDFKQENVKMMT